MGKGSKLRPLNKQIFDQNFDEILWNKDLSKPYQTAKGKNKQIKRYVYK